MSCTYSSKNLLKVLIERYSAPVFLEAPRFVQNCPISGYYEHTADLVGQLRTLSQNIREKLTSLQITLIIVENILINNSFTMR